MALHYLVLGIALGLVGGVKDPRLELLDQACTKVIAHCSLDRSSVAYGDINRDGLEDAVSFVGNPRSWSSPNNHVYAVALIADAIEGFRTLAVTGEIEVSMGTQPFLEVREGSIFLKDGGSGGCCSRWSRSFQFLFRNNQLRLVGEEYRSGVTANDLPSDDYGMSINYLTGKTIAWRKNSKGRREFEVDFEMPPIFFDGFDFNHLREQQPAELQVYVDDELQLVRLGE